jgi:Ca2+-binding RTX toxin-like protein
MAVLAFAGPAWISPVVDTETITGGSGADAVTLSGALTTGMAVDLGGGANTLNLANGGNTGTVSNVTTLIGGTGADNITLGAALVNGSIDLGGGSDTLQLAGGTNKVSVTNTETVFGGSGNDTIVMTGANASTVVGGAGINFITGNTGADEFVFNQTSGSDYSTVQTFNAGKSTDTIALDTTNSQTLTGNEYDLGGVALADNTNLKAVVNAAVRYSVTEIAGKGGFVYAEDTGGLYYSANGSFAGGGGTLIGKIDSSPGVAWTYDATKFMEV